MTVQRNGAGSMVQRPVAPSVRLEHWSTRRTSLESKIDWATLSLIPDATLLRDATENFILDFTNKSELVDSALFLTATFAIDAYRDELFELLSINFPEQLENAVLKRRAEFLAGRVLAKIAIRHFSAADGNLPVGPSRQPLWPQGLVGSLSHSRRHAVSIVSDNSTMAIGVDVEAICSEELSESISDIVLSLQERAFLKSFPENYCVLWTLAFSAKETLFKALFPTVGNYFGFDCAKICGIDMQRRRLLLELTMDLCETLQHGAQFWIDFVLEEEVVMTFLLDPGTLR